MSTFVLALLGWIVASFLLGPLFLYIVSEPASDDVNERPSAPDARHRGVAA